MAAVMVWRGFDRGVRQGSEEQERISVPDTYGDNLFSPGPWPATAAPWLDILENPDAPGLPLDLVSEPNMPRPDTGALPIVGPYMPAEIGPVTAFGHEGQNLGRTMRFATNSVMRGPGQGEGSSSDQGPSYADELAAAIAANGQGQVSDQTVNGNLVMFR